MEVLENVPLHTRRPSIMELVSCVAGLWLDCGLDTVRGKHRHGGNEPENIISAATTSSPAASHKCYLINSKHLLWPRIFSQYLHIWRPRRARLRGCGCGYGYCWQLPIGDVVLLTRTSNIV